jgi:translation initiation factor 1
MGKKSKKRENVVYSTNPNFAFDDEESTEEETLENSKQLLYVSIDRKQRKGKDVTLVEGFVGMEEDLKDLGKMLKSSCGVGGTVKGGEILIQGNHRDKILEILKKDGFRTKRKGG